MVQINRVHTGSGDSGETSLVDGSRVLKSHPRLMVVGLCDELNTSLGLVIMESNRLSEIAHDGGPRPTVRRVKAVLSASMSRVQQELFDLGAELACPLDAIPEYMELIDENDSDMLLEELDAWNQKLTPLKSFIMPTGSPPVALVHHSRTMARRLERHMVGLGDEIRPIALQYVNRLSDWLFVLARWITHCLGESEVLWVPKGQRAVSGESPKDIQESLEKDFDEL